MTQPHRAETAYISDIRVGPDYDTARSRYIAVVMHPNVEHLRRAATRRAPSTSWDGVHGCFHPAHHRERFHDGDWVDSSTGYAGTLRLHRDAATPLIITHEATHAAAALWRAHLWHQGKRDLTLTLNDDCGHPEEDFAHLLGGIAGALFDLVPHMLERTPKRRRRTNRP